LEFNANEGRGKSVDYEFKTKINFLQNDNTITTPRPVKTQGNNGDIISHRDRYQFPLENIVKERQTLTFCHPTVEIKLLDLKMP
jgi:hypothetical protein